jgi:hypothetical protein
LIIEFIGCLWLVTTNHNAQNYWVSGLCASYGIINTGKNNVSETGSVSAFRWKDPTE